MKNLVDKLRLYVLISSNIATKSVKETAELVIHGGADAIQLREKTISDTEFKSLSREIHDLTTRKGILLIINDRIKVAKEINADGVHLGQFDNTVSEARNILGTGKIIGVSTHTISQAKEAQRLGADYIAVGPIYATKTKTHEPPVGLKLIQEITKEIDIPIIAIGAITLSNVKEVLRAGASRIAVCSAIINSKDILSSTEEFKHKLASFSH